jgi:hypothetical protein
VDLYVEGCSPEQIIDHFPTLPLALVHKVIAFYLDNRADVDAYVVQSRVKVERLAAEAVQGPDHAELRRRMEAKRRLESA